VHELPAKWPYEPEEVHGFLGAAIRFIQATDVVIHAIVTGDRPPLTQTEMNQVSGASFRVADEELVELCRQVAQKTDSNSIHEVQKYWQEFRKAEAERQTERFGRGTIRPTIRNVIAEEVTKARITQLRSWLEDQQDDR
jgi:uncharacterized protein YecT (DUF1311 family)